MDNVLYRAGLPSHAMPTTRVQPHDCSYIAMPQLNKHQKQNSRITSGKMTRPQRSQSNKQINRFGFTNGIETTTEQQQSCSVTALHKTKDATNRDNEYYAEFEVELERLPPRSASLPRIDRVQSSSGSPAMKQRGGSNSADVVAMRTRRKMKTMESRWARMSAGKSANPQPREFMQRTRRHPTAIDPADGLPPKPTRFAKGSVMQFRRMSQIGNEKQDEKQSSSVCDDIPDIGDAGENISKSKSSITTARERHLTIAELILSQRLEKLKNSRKRDHEILEHPTNETDNDEEEDDDILQSTTQTTDKQHDPQLVATQSKYQMPDESSTAPESGAAPEQSAVAMRRSPMPLDDEDRSFLVSDQDEFQDYDNDFEPEFDRADDDLEHSALASAHREFMLQPNAANSQTTNTTAFIEHLARHVYDDDSDEEQPWSDSDTSALLVARQRNASRNEMQLAGLNASLTQSQISRSLPYRTVTNPQRLRRIDTPQIESDENATVEKDDSGVDDDSQENACPVMDLIFDPDLNCYFNPNDGTFYRVANIQPND